MLEGHSISIRIIKEQDLEHFLNRINNVENQGSFLPASMTSETRLRGDYAKDGFVSELTERYLITSKSDEILGSIWAFKSVPYFDAIEVGYQIFNPEHRGQGYVTEALTLFQDYLFETKQINRIELRIATENEPSSHVARKIGFILEGTNREAAFSKGRLHDMDIYAMLRSEWLAK